MMHKCIAPNRIFWLKLAGVALIYVLFAKLVLPFASASGNVSILWLPSGWALAVVLVGGKKYWPGVFVGAFLVHVFGGEPVWLASVIATGATLEALIGLWLLERNGKFNLAMRQCQEYFRLLVLAGLVGPAVSAIIGTTALLLAGVTTMHVYLHSMLFWWLGDMFGVILLTPFLLVLKQMPTGWNNRAKIVEGILLLVCALVVGQIVYCGLFQDFLGFYLNNFVMLVFAIWAAMRFGSHGVLIILCIALIQGLYGVSHKVGYFSQDMASTGLFDFWIYYVEYTIVSMTLATNAQGRKDALESLRQNEERLKFALEGSGDGPWDRNVQTGEVFFSRRWKEILGYGDQEIGNDDSEWKSRIHPEDLPRTLSALQAHFDGKTESYSNEQRMLCKDGQWRWILTRGKLVSRDAIGRPERIIGTYSDITEPKILQKQQIHAVIDASPDSMLKIGPDGIIRHANQVAEKVFGYPLQELIGLNVDKLLPLSARSLHAGKRSQFLHNPRPQPMRFRNDLRALRKNGNEFPVEVSLSPLEMNGETVVLVAVLDITQRKAAEHAIQKAKETAEAASKAKSDFLANMSHEIRTPMNAIIGFSHLGLSEMQPEKLRGYLAQVNQSSIGLLGIINDILDFSKIEAGKLDMDIAPFSLRQCVEELRKTMEIFAKARGLSLVFTLDSAVPEILLGDQLRLRQVLNNLISNAIKFSTEGEINIHVEVSDLQQSQITLQFSVVDHGIGMSADQLAKLFQPFTQADTSTTRKYGGTGLGLAISRQLVELMGGNIQATSKSGAGSTFSFSVVMKEVHDYETPLRNCNHSKSTINGKQVLLVEDNKVNQLLAQTLLANAGVAVTIANNGREAVEILSKSNSYDAVLMDIQMPEMDGHEATSYIRNQLKLTELPIIALTAHVIGEERQRCLDSGMNSIITKPILVQALYETLAIHINH